MGTKEARAEGAFAHAQVQGGAGVVEWQSGLANGAIKGSEDGTVHAQLAQSAGQGGGDIRQPTRLGEAGDLRGGEETAQRHGMDLTPVQATGFSVAVLSGPATARKRHAVCF
jgi:hypothetical protein